MTYDNKTITNLKHGLAQFYGSTSFYRHPLFRRFLYTEGVQYLAENAGAYWLLDLIFGKQLEHKAILAEPFQTWDLTVKDDKTAELIVTDGDLNVIHKHHLNGTDFPLRCIRLFFTGNTLMLPGEY